jgi:hypothetical protein
MFCNPDNSEKPSQCSVCGRRCELFDLPPLALNGERDLEVPEKYCLACSADVATSILLTTEIDAATLSGQDASPLVSEFAQLCSRLLARSQSL